MHFPCLTLLAKKSITKALIIFTLWTAEYILPEFYLCCEQDFEDGLQATHCCNTLQKSLHIGTGRDTVNNEAAFTRGFAGYFKLTKMCRWQFSPEAEIRAVKSYEFLLQVAIFFPFFSNLLHPLPFFFQSSYYKTFS